ncbi:MAG: ribulose-phosphate 3-epimerase [Bacteroidetes bacterium GWC2_33_15]|nr:MAG: ribulose-phosphate 3-epimerase [Bacteroidetes bacterium GWA2_33_15]OFX51792.1 MAG: ribulose-phosphate 3-epimerase [Bacteroidetes bacterium GWC2_33_15]OFX66836.1 MAG: ribulose-phosphate 3-epimerase [Bacteroidetes bacterium GWB2_32_14]OFX67094.1 MAG: ribulose-phosphate 3-epimerase [Bacteroidetes bacterium GWD2_33_33]HAN17185.1 ribulose-phosphate 3-epimerase [Bacteroidales bacterium]
MQHLISPSLLSADFGNLQRDIEMINKSEADWFHLDIMDGVFVPNISFGFPVIKYIKKHARKPLDVHLMIIDPDRYIEEFNKAGADILTVHYETCNHLHRTVQNIKSHGMKAGVSLNPHTPVHVLEDIIADIDLVLIMSVNPGFGGQKFIPNALDKIKKLKKLILDKKSNALIEVDGGVDQTNAKLLIDAGCDVLVAGNYIFGSPDQIKTISELRNI